jgi:hypothetical protein
MHVTSATRLRCREPRQGGRHVVIECESFSGNIPASSKLSRAGVVLVVCVPISQALWWVNLLLTKFHRLLSYPWPCLEPTIVGKRTSEDFLKSKTQANTPPYHLFFLNSFATPIYDRKLFHLLSLSPSKPHPDRTSILGCENEWYVNKPQVLQPSVIC